jgi:transcription termination factor NusB
VDIAKCFGTAESGAFVNGILDNIAKKYAEGKE